MPPVLPPRPASYTPSASEPTYLPLNNLDTIRSYGSAADELETYPMLGLPVYNGNGIGSVGGHNNPDYHPNLNRPTGVGLASGNGGTGLTSPPLLMPSHDALSDTDSVHKPRWSDLESNLKGSYYEAAKIHNGTSLMIPSQVTLFYNTCTLPFIYPSSLSLSVLLNLFPFEHWPVTNYYPLSLSPTRFWLYCYKLE